MDPLTRKINTNLKNQGMFQKDTNLFDVHAIEIIDEAYNGYLLYQTNIFDKWIQEAKEFLEQSNTENSLIFKEIGKLFLEKFNETNNLFLSRIFSTKELSSRNTEEEWSTLLKRESTGRNFRIYWKKDQMEDYRLIYNIRDKDRGKESTGRADVFVITIVGLMCIIQKHYPSPINFRDLFGFSNKQLIGRDEQLFEFSKDYLELNNDINTKKGIKQRHFVIYGKSGIGKSELANKVIDNSSEYNGNSCIFLFDSRSLESNNFTPHKFTSNIKPSFIKSIKGSRNFIDFFDKLESLINDHDFSEIFVFLDQCEKLFEKFDLDFLDIKGGILNTFKSSKLNKIHCVFITSEHDNLNDWWKTNVFKELKENLTTYLLKPIDGDYASSFQNELKLKMSLISYFIEDVQILQKFHTLLETESNRIISRIIELSEKFDDQMTINPFYFHFYLNCLFDLFLGYSKKQDFSDSLLLFDKNPYDSIIEKWMGTLLNDVADSNLLIKDILKIAREQRPILLTELVSTGFNENEVNRILDMFTLKRILGPSGKIELYFQHDLLLKLVNDRINYIPEDIKQELLKIKILEKRLEKLDSISSSEIVVINEKYNQLMKYIEDKDTIDKINTLLLHYNQKNKLQLSSLIDSALRYYSKLTFTDVPHSYYENLDMILKRILDTYEEFSDEDTIVKQIQYLINLISKVAPYSNKSRLKFITLLPDMNQLKLNPLDMGLIKQIIEIKEVSYKDELEIEKEITVICETLEKDWKISDSREVKAIIFSLAGKLSSLVCSSILDLRISSVQQLDDESLVELVAYIGNKTFDKALINYFSYISASAKELKSIEPLLEKLDVLKWVTIKNLYPNKLPIDFINKEMLSKISKTNCLLSLDILREFNDLLAEHVKLEILNSILDRCTSVIHLGNVSRSYKSIISENKELELKLLNLLVENRIELYPHILTYEKRHMKMFPKLIRDGIHSEIRKTNNEFIEIISKLEVNEQDTESISLDKLSFEILKGLTGLQLDKYTTLLSTHYPEELLSFIVTLLNLKNTNYFFDYIAATIIKNLSNIDSKYQNLFLNVLISDKDKYAKIISRLFIDNSFDINDFFVLILESIDSETLIEYYLLVISMIDYLENQEFKYNVSPYNSFLSLYIETLTKLFPLQQNEEGIIVDGYQKFLKFLKTSSVKVYLENDISIKLFETFHNIIQYLNTKKNEPNFNIYNLQKTADLFLSCTKIDFVVTSDKPHYILNESLEEIYRNDELKDSLFSTITEKQYPRYMQYLTKIAFKIYPIELEDLFLSLLNDEVDSELLSQFPDGIIDHLIETRKSEIKEVLLGHLPYIIDNFNYFSPFGNMNDLLQKIGITEKEKRKLIIDLIESNTDNFTDLFDKNIEDFRFFIELIKDKKISLNKDNYRKNVPNTLYTLLQVDENALEILESTLEELEDLETFEGLLEVYLDDFYFYDFERQLSFLFNYISQNGSNLKNYAICRMFNLLDQRRTHELKSFFLENEKNFKNLCALMKEHYFLLQDLIHSLLFHILISSNLSINIKTSISDFFSSFVFKKVFWESEQNLNIIGILISFCLMENHNLNEKFFKQIFALYIHIVNELKNTEFNLHNILEKIVTLLIKASHENIIETLFHDFEKQMLLLGTDFKKRLIDSFNIQIKEFEKNKQFETFPDKQFESNKVISAVYWIIYRLFHITKANNRDEYREEIIQYTIKKMQEYLNSSEIFMKIIALNFIHSWQNNLSEELIVKLLDTQSKNNEESILLLTQIFWQRKPFADFIEKNWMEMLKKINGQKIIKKIMKQNLSLDQFLLNRANSH